jgi:HemY protein
VTLPDLSASLQALDEALRQRLAAAGLRMGRLFIVALLALLAGVGIVALIETEPGYLLIAYGGYTVETSFWVGIVLIGRLCSRCTRCCVFCTGSAQQPRQRAQLGRCSGACGSRAPEQSRPDQLYRGQLGRARRSCCAARSYSEAPLLNYLMAARASYRLQEPEAMREYLAAGGGVRPRGRFAVDLTQAETAAAGEAVRGGRAHDADPGRPQRPANTPMCCTCCAGLRWPWRYRGGGGPDAGAAQTPHAPARSSSMIWRSAYSSRSDRAGRGNRRCRSAAGALEEIPGAFARQEGRSCTTSSRSWPATRALAVEKEIVRQLKKHWRPALVNLYGRIPRESAQKQLATAEGWLKQHPDDPELLLCLGRLALVEREWVKARDYLERSHALHP